MVATPAIQFDDVLGHPARSEGWFGQGVSTYTRAFEALAAGQFTEASDLALYTVQEASEANHLYAEWTESIPQIMMTRGVSAQDIAEDDGRLQSLVSPAGSDRLDSTLGWQQYRALIDDCRTACAARDAERAAELLDQARARWQDTHDRACDLVYGWLDAAARRLGEDCIGPIWDELMVEGYAFYERYDLDVNPWERSFGLVVRVMFEGMRGHLTGPDRRGDLEVIEEEDRWGIRFDPCGSGGRTYRGDDIAGPRMNAPYNFGVTTAEHDWAWNKTGICLYCTHCCQLMEQNPIAKFGYPIRVVDPPTWPAAQHGGKCTWWVYKDPTLVPEWVYSRVGARKPNALGSAAVQSGVPRD